jgi:CMP-N-acetylneuraminic acid synthetase
MKSKTAIIIHLKENSQRVKSKNFLKIKSKPLYKIAFNKLLNEQKHFDVYVHSSSLFFQKESKKFGFNFIKRPKKLDQPNAQGNELLEDCMKSINNKIIIQFFVTNPFLKVKTLKKIISKINTSEKINSVTAVYAIYNRAWYKSQPINHKFNKLIGTQYMEPIYIESGVYCFKRSSFLKDKSRISKKNIFITITGEESFDIDTKFDYSIASSMVRNKPSLID